MASPSHTCKDWRHLETQLWHWPRIVGRSVFCLVVIQIDPEQKYWQLLFVFSLSLQVDPVHNGGKCLPAREGYRLWSVPCQWALLRPGTKSFWHHITLWSHVIICYHFASYYRVIICNHFGIILLFLWPGNHFVVTVSYHLASNTHYVVLLSFHHHHHRLS